MSFTRDWLALRAAADLRSRAADLMAMAAAVATSRCEAHLVEVVDLGAGTGATMRALAPMISARQHWTLVDSDPELLAEAERLTAAAPPASDLLVTTSVADLSVEPDLWAGVPDLVTASALFDIVSMRFIGRLTERLSADRIPLLATLTYDGAMTLAPSHPSDVQMERAFNAHQRAEKSFGRAVGPDGIVLLSQTLEAAGFIVHTRDSAWRLERTTDAALMDATIDGWAAAARAVMPDDGATVDAWLGHARAADELTVGHSDLLALP